MADLGVAGPVGEVGFLNEGVGATKTGAGSRRVEVRGAV